MAFMVRAVCGFQANSLIDQKHSHHVGRPGAPRFQPLRLDAAHEIAARPCVEDTPPTRA